MMRLTKGSPQYPAVAGEGASRVSRFIRTAAGKRPVQLAVKALLSLGWAFDRIWSNAKFGALFPASFESACHWSVRITYPERISIGRRVAIAPGCWLGGRGGISIGDDVLISPGVTIDTASLDTAAGSPPYPYVAAPIVIEHGAWIGAGATILGGVTIGAGGFVGAGTVVTKDVPPHSVVVGAAQRSLQRK